MKYYVNGDSQAAATKIMNDHTFAESTKAIGV